VTAGAGGPRGFAWIVDDPPTQPPRDTPPSPSQAAAGAAAGDGSHWSVDPAPASHWTADDRSAPHSQSAARAAATLAARSRGVANTGGIRSLAAAAAAAGLDGEEDASTAAQSPATGTAKAKAAHKKGRLKKNSRDPAGDGAGGTGALGTRDGTGTSSRAGARKGSSRLPPSDGKWGLVTRASSVPPSQGWLSAGAGDSSSGGGLSLAGGSSRVLSLDGGLQPANHSTSQQTTGPGAGGTRSTVASAAANLLRKSAADPLPAPPHSTLVTVPSAPSTSVEKVNPEP
jgi:hypothetical protein